MRCSCSKTPADEPTTGANEIENFPTIADIEAARQTIAGHVARTPCRVSRTLGDILGCELWLKFENLQFTASFKERGALNFLAALPDDKRAKGVVAMSAGNHAQGVAFHANRLAIPATIVMPDGTPHVKVENTQRLGAEVIVTGATLEDASAAANAICDARGLTFVHPYDDPRVIAGQGTIAFEILEDAPALDCLIVPIGGGGLVSGLAIAAKALNPKIEIIGVQAKLFPAMYNLIKAQDLPSRGDTLAEGIAVKAPGRLTREIVARHVDDIVLVTEAALERAVAQLINIEKTVVEGAGAAGVAAIFADADRFRGRKVATLLCGGNIDTRLLASVLTRDLARQGRLAQLTIELQDRPGQLARVAIILSEAGANVVEVLHQRVFSDLPAKGAELEVVIETRDRAHLDATISALEADGLAVDCEILAGYDTPAERA